jgi:hypothetical protein
MNKTNAMFQTILIRIARFGFSSVWGLFGRQFVSDFEILILSLFGLRFVSNFVLRISDLRLEKLLRISDFEVNLLS